MTSSDLAREYAEATSRGLNVLYELAHGPRQPGADNSPNADQIDALEGLVAALEHARDPGIVTDYLASPEQISAVRTIAALVADWLKTGQRTEDVAQKAGALYVALTA